MSVNSYLENLGSSLILSDSEKESISKSINYLERNLKEYFGSNVLEHFQFGSSTRGTILPRKYDSESDIDYMIVFDNANNYTPQTFLTRLKNFAEAYYSRSEIYQDSPTIVLELNHIKFELVPAYKSYMFYYIHDGKGGWLGTNPNDINSSLREANKNCKFILKPVIRLMKHWNISLNYRGYSSYNLESKLVSELKYSYIFNTSYTDYLLNAFDSLNKAYYFPTKESKRLTTAIEKIKEALDLEKRGMPYSAEQKIKEIFPEK